MTPEDILTDLSARLRSEGIRFAPADLEAFADASRRSISEHDIESLAQRFRDAQEAAVRVLRRKRVRAWLEGACVAGIGVVFLGFGVLWLLVWIAEWPAATSPANNTASAIWLLIGTFLLAVGGSLMAVACTRAIRTSRRLTSEIARIENPDAIS